MARRRTSGAWQVVDPRNDDADPIRRRAEFAASAGRQSDHLSRQGAAPPGTSRPRWRANAPLIGHAGLQPSRVMDQRRHPVQRQPGEGRQRQPVDQLEAVRGKRRPGGPRGIDRRLVRVGQPSAQFHDLHLVPQCAQAVRHATIVGVATGHGPRAARVRSGTSASAILSRFRCAVTRRRRSQRP